MCLIFFCWSFSPCRKGKDVEEDLTDLRYFSLHEYLSQLLCLTDLEHQRFQFIDQICTKFVRGVVRGVGPADRLNIPEFWNTTSPKRD